jgi:hypothetical protein
MTMTPAVRRLALTAHVVSSVGWLGSVTVFLALAVSGMASDEPQMVRADYLVMNSITWFVIVPLCVASVLTGFASSLGTTLGLFRHYWILIKLLITVPATVALFVHIQPIGLISRIAAERAVTGADSGLQIQMLAAAGAALVALLVATVISIYKPRGLTQYGWRKQQERLQSLP